MRAWLHCLVAGTLALAGALVAPFPCFAQVGECPECILGLYADSLLTATEMPPSGDFVDLYLGIRYGTGTATELSGIEFSITGLDSFLVTTMPLDSPSAVLGTPLAPVGADTLSSAGGMNIAWGRCLAGDRVLAKLRLVPRHAWPQGTVLRVRRRYPVSSQNLPTPVLTRCDEPVFTSASVRGGTFLLGPAGSPQCAVLASTTDFGTIPEGRHRWLDFTVANQGAGILEGAVGEACTDFWLQEGDPGFLLAAGQSRSFRLRFSPTQPGAQECTISISSGGCPPLVFTGGAPEVMPIAALYAGLDSLVDRRVAVEAQVMLPSWSPYASREKFGWIQDEAGYGLEIHNTTIPGRANRVRLSGRVLRHGTMPMLDSLTAVAVTAIGLSPIVARARTAAQLQSAPGHGTFVEFFGHMTYRTDEWPAQRYRIEDATGEIEAVVVVGPTPPGGVDLFVRGAWAQGSYGGIWVSNDADFRIGAPCSVQAVTVGTGIGSLGQTLEIPVRLARTQSALDTLALWIGYDHRVLRPTGARNAGFTAGWPACTLDPSRPDTLVLFATGPTPTPVDTTGDVFQLSFEIVGCSPRRSPLQVLRADGALALARFCPGFAICTDCASDGDVNADGALSPGDARCAFEIFLAAETVPAECDAPGDCEVAAADANCDAQVTPGDGLDIFGDWLADRPTPVACVPKPRVEAGAASAGWTRYRIGLDAARALGPEDLAVAVERRGAASPAAFGAEIFYDPARLEFVGLQEVGDGQAWEALDARAVVPGRLRVGGFDPRRVAIASSRAEEEPWAPLADLVFRGDRAALASARVEWIEQLPEGSPATALPPVLALGRPYPNPIVGGELRVELGIPRGGSLAVRARVLDVRGRQVAVLQEGRLGPGVHVLRWNRADAGAHPVAAGIYVLEVRLGDKLERRKIVVLE